MRLGPRKRKLAAVESGKIVSGGSPPPGGSEPDPPPGKTDPLVISARSAIMKSARLCLACGNSFHPLLRVPNQRYCSAAACQRERRRRWQRRRLRVDADYRDNQARAQAQMARSSPGLLASIPRDAPGLPGAQLRDATGAECATKFQSSCKHGRVTSFTPARIRLLHTASCRRNGQCKYERVHRPYRCAVGTKRATHT